MSVADPTVSQPTQSPRAWREVVRGWMIFGLFLGVLAIPLYGVYSLSEMIALQPNIEKAGGNVQLEIVGPQWLKDFAGRDYVWLFGTPISLNAPQRQKVDDRWVKQVRRMTSLRSLGLENTQVTDRGLASLEPLTDLESVALSHTTIGDAGLEHIRGLTKLRWVSLDGTQVSEDGLACLVGMNLSMLNLADTNLRGPGLKHLAGMKELGWLNLESTQLDDHGLDQLPALPSLRCLHLGGIEDHKRQTSEAESLPLTCRAVASQHTDRRRRN